MYLEKCLIQDLNEDSFINVNRFLDKLMSTDLQVRNTSDGWLATHSRQNNWLDFEKYMS